jgi:hypothetical protein
VRVDPGQLLRFRAILKPFERGSDLTYGFSVRVPRRLNQAMGFVEVGGAPGPPRVCFAESECEGGPAVKSFDALLRLLDGHPKNNVLTATHRTGQRMKVKSKRSWTTDAVVRGFRMVFLVPPGGGGGSGGGEGEGKTLGGGD